MFVASILVYQPAHDLIAIRLAHCSLIAPTCQQADVVSVCNFLRANVAQSCLEDAG